MKSAQAYKGTLLLSLALHANAECGVYRSREVKNDIGSENACALLCADSSPVQSICSYHPPSKRCIIGSPDGKDISYSNVTYMVKVDDIEDQKDPFKEDCKVEKDTWLKQEAAFKAELAKCQAGPIEPLCPQHDKKLYTAPDGKRYIIYCNLAIYGNWTNGYKTAPGTSLTDCIEQCARMADCGPYEPIPTIEAEKQKSNSDFDAFKDATKAASPAEEKPAEDDGCGSSAGFSRTKKKGKKSALIEESTPEQGHTPAPEPEKKEDDDPKAQKKKLERKVKKEARAREEKVAELTQLAKEAKAERIRLEEEDAAEAEKKEDDGWYYWGS
ncbi:hypothetical protein EKO04_003927 [Ascochyta lentis]|uniref:Apple domain-containing protein n=1 Tax=Ascochyta lentis TaxID=205686 RepID=A0A8H7J9Z6_9PLEO|nr:hypothetical protein EKO04_003927 [Ascochyta lentis]